jgi:hypothetical protein
MGRSPTVDELEIWRDQVRDGSDEPTHPDEAVLAEVDVLVEKNDNIGAAEVLVKALSTGQPRTVLLRRLAGVEGVLGNDEEAIDLRIEE